MNSQALITTIDKLIEETKELSTEKDEYLVLQKIALLVQKAFRGRMEYIDTLGAVSFRPKVLFENKPQVFQNAKLSVLRILNSMKEDIQLDIVLGAESTKDKPHNPIDLSSKKVFLVHGHNDGMKQSMQGALAS